MEIDMAVTSLEDTTPPEEGREPPVRPSKQQEKTYLAEPRFEHGSVSTKDSAFKDPDFSYALACSLQNPRDREVLGQLLTPELRMKTFQGLINVSFVLNTLSVIHVSVIFLYLCHICIHKAPNAFSS